MEQLICLNEWLSCDFRKNCDAAHHWRILYTCIWKDEQPHKIKLYRANFIYLINSRPSVKAAQRMKGVSP